MSEPTQRIVESNGIHLNSRIGRAEEGSGYSSAQRLRSPPLVETARMVVSETGCPTGLSGYCRPAIPLNPSDRRA